MPIQKRYVTECSMQLSQNMEIRQVLSVFGIIAAVLLFAFHSLQLFEVIGPTPWVWWLTALVITFFGTCLYLGAAAKSPLSNISKLVFGYGIAVVVASALSIGPYTFETANLATNALMLWVGSVCVSPPQCSLLRKIAP